MWLDMDRCSELAACRYVCVCVVVVYGSYTLEYNCHIPRASCIHGYKQLDIIVQATYTIALLWFIELYARGAYNSNKPLKAIV